ncbi:hypothetical protein [Aeromonas veronii]|uniref:hypothetical protein n=1 Tax=Aeromonas veronii TaxID=654 RepID=UPI001F0AA5B3|nr:hypothetical protein [Aeromonas veronii]
MVIRTLVLPSGIVCVVMQPPSKALAAVNSSTPAVLIRKPPHILLPELFLCCHDKLFDDIALLHREPKAEGPANFRDPAVADMNSCGLHEPSGGHGCPLNRIVHKIPSASGGSLASMHATPSTERYRRSDT